MSVLASIEPVDLKVDPGGEASLTVRVRNRGTIVDRYDIVIVGPTAPWASVDQPSLRLFPDKEGEARVTFRPPRAPDPAADTYPFGIHVKAASDPNASTVEEGRITVSPFVELVTDIVPQTSRGSRSGSHEVTIHNLGNSVADVSIKATDPDRLLSFRIAPERTGMRPDASATVRARVQPKDTFLMGPPKRVPFSVQVDEPTAGSYQLPATLEQRAIIPSWVKPLASLAVAGLAAIVFLPPILQAVFPTPTQAVVIPTPSPTSAPTQAPPSAPTQAPPTPLGPPVSPTPGPTVFGPPDTLTATGDGGTTHPNIIVDCPPDGPTADACRAQIAGLVQRVLSNTLGVADGAPLDVFETDVTGTLAVVAIWEDGSWPVRDNRVTDPIKYARKVAIDLAPLLQFGTAYVLVDDGSGEVLPYIVSTGNAQLLLDSMYTVLGAPTPVPDPTGPGATARWDPGFWDRAFLWGQQLNTIQFGN